MRNTGRKLYFSQTREENKIRKETYLSIGAKQYKNRQFYLLGGKTHTLVFSYDTLIGYISGNRFYTWGYGRYSTTTTRQITMFSRERNLILVLDSEEKIKEQLLNL